MLSDEKGVFGKKSFILPQDFYYLTGETRSYKTRK